MAKKKNRTTRTSTAVSRPAIAQRMKEAAAAEAARNVNLSEEYHYVISDIRQIALIAGTLVLALIVLSFFLK